MRLLLLEGLLISARIVNPGYRTSLKLSCSAISGESSPRIPTIQPVNGSTCSWARDSFATGILSYFRTLNLGANLWQSITRPLRLEARKLPLSVQELARPIRACQMSYWLLKTEPDEWGWEHQSANGGKSQWDGVRNPVAQRNMKAMEVGDLCFFYHTGKERAIVGIVSVCRKWYPETGSSQPDAATSEEGTQLAVSKPTLAVVKNKKGDESSGAKWGQVDVQEVVAFEEPVTLKHIKGEAGRTIEDFVLLRQPRLSVLPVSEQNWVSICEMGGLDSAPQVPWTRGVANGRAANEGAREGAGLEGPGDKTKNTAGGATRAASKGKGAGKESRAEGQGRSRPGSGQSRAQKGEEEKLEGQAKRPRRNSKQEPSDAEKWAANGDHVGLGRGRRRAKG